jgi:hypothetical protein
VKEKTRVAAGGDTLRFQGTIALPNGRRILDRTSLIPLSVGRVRQVIERSTGGGATWTTGFDATYSPVASDPDPS